MKVVNQFLSRINKEGCRKCKKAYHSSAIWVSNEEGFDCHLLHQFWGQFVVRCEEDRFIQDMCFFGPPLAHFHNKLNEKSWPRGLGSSVICYIRVITSDLSVK